MFAILADKLYSNKPLAVVREIACNALDAHGMNGQARPILVAAPSAIEPMLVIRDHGPGMDHVQVMTNYTQFGASTKDESDDQIGGFGLGCKAPFAYSDAFTVTVWRDGERRDYAAYRGPDGIPQMSLAGREDCDINETGVEVRVPIKPDDFHVFNRTIAQVLKWFPAGSYEAYGVEVPAVEWSSQAEGYGVLTASPDRAVVLMGPVAYPLDWNVILTEGQKALPAVMVMTFGIGELDLLPSREGLSYDKRTLAALRDRYAQVAAAVAADLFERAKSLPRIEQVLYIQDLKANGTWSFVQTAYREKDKDGKITNDGFPGISEEFSLSPAPLLRSHVEKGRKASWYSDSLKMEVNSQRRTTINVSDLRGDAVFIFDDIPDAKASERRVTARLKEFCRESMMNLTFFIVSKDVPVGTGLSLDELMKRMTEGEEIPDGEKAYPPGLATFDALVAGLAGLPNLGDRVLKLSELPLPERRVQAREKRTTTLRVLVTKGSDYGSYNWGGGSFWDTREGVTAGVYIPMTNYDVEKGFDAKWANYALMQDVDILGLSKKARDQIKRDNSGDDFERIDHYVKRIAAELQADPEVMVELRRRATLSELHKNPVVRKVAKLSSAPDFLTLFPKLDVLSAYATPAEPPVVKRANHLADFLSRQGKPRPKAHKAQASVVRAVETHLARSPLLRFALEVQERHGDNIFFIGGNNLPLLAKAKGAVTQ